MDVCKIAESQRNSHDRTEPQQDSQLCQAAERRQSGTFARERANASEWLGADFCASLLGTVWRMRSTLQKVDQHGISLAIFGTANPKTASFVQFD